MFKSKRTGQSIAEYAVVLGIVIAAVVAMQIYVKRQLQGKMKGAVDFVPNEDAKTSYFKTLQFEPNYATSTMNTTRSGETTINATEGSGKVVRNIVGNQESTRTGVQTTAGYQ